MTDVQKQDFTRRISLAGSTELVVILYDMSLLYMEDAERALTEEREDDFTRAVSHSRNCLRELMASLHMEYEPAPALLSLYHFCVRRLAACEAMGDAGPLEEVRRVLEPLREAYAKLSAETPQEPVMDHTQHVYMGLTYGRHELSESLVTDVNRGFRV